MSHETAAPARWQRRHILVAMSFLACVIAYTDRVNISVAAVAMKEDLGWTQTQKGLVLSSFFVGYMLFMFASGRLASRYGGKRVLGGAVLIWSVFTLVTPLAAGASLAALVLARVGMGAGEAAMFPATYEMYSRWIPATERTRAVARLMSGIPIGTVAGLVGTGWILGRFHWPMAFYLFGVLGLVWVAWWFARVSNDPKADPHVSNEERELIAVGHATGPVHQPFPWRTLFRYPAVWSSVAAHFATTWSLYVLLSWLPSYFREVQGLSIANAGFFSAAPWFAMFAVTNVAAAVADGMIARGSSLTATRRWMQCTGLIGSALFLLVALDVRTPAAALLLLCGATGMLGLTWSGYAPNSLEIAPRHAASLVGFSNTIATIPGIIGVAVTGWLVDVTGTYAAAFILTAAVSGIGALTYGTLFRADPITD